jgi:hypothetical protein
LQHQIGPEISPTSPSVCYQLQVQVDYLVPELDAALADTPGVAEVGTGAALGTALATQVGAQ